MASEAPYQVNKNKGRQAVQGASPVHHTEELLRRVFAQCPDPYGRHTPDHTPHRQTVNPVTPISQLTDICSPADSHPLEFGAVNLWDSIGSGIKAILL